jgi:hypothetical protein
MRDLEAERAVDMMRAIVKGIRRLRSYSYASKTGPATVFADAPTWTAPLARELQYELDCFHCNAQVYWRDGQHAWMVKRGAQ